jgi:peptidoglycan-associated lipoprotein
MKLAKLAYLTAVAMAFSLTVVGCRKGLDKTTHIPGGKGASPTIGESGAAGVRDPGPGTPITSDTSTGNNTVRSDTPQGNIGASTTDITGWDQNRDEFKAQTVYFDYDKSNIKPGELAKLEEVARRMKSSFQGKALLVEGHCDERGTEEYNRSLGDKRAQSGREKLVQLGLSADVIHTISFGEEKPAESGHDEAAWKKNRRIELILCSPPGAK